MNGWFPSAQCLQDFCFCLEDILGGWTWDLLSSNARSPWEAGAGQKSPMEEGGFSQRNFVLHLEFLHCFRVSVQALKSCSEQWSQTVGSSTLTGSISYSFRQEVSPSPTWRCTWTGAFFLSCAPLSCGHPQRAFLLCCHFRGF